MAISETQRARRGKGASPRSLTERRSRRRFALYRKGASSMFQSKLARVAFSILLAGTLTACAKPEPAKPAVDTAKVAEDVKADLHQLVADFNAHDAAKAVGHDAPDYVGMFHGQPNVRG